MISKLIDDGVFEHIGKIKSLKVILDAPVRGKGLDHLKNLPNLRELDLAETVITPTNLQGLTGFNPKSLQIPEISMTDLGLEYYLAATQGQSSIDLSDWRYLKGRGYLTCNLGYNRLTERYRLDKSYDVVKGFRFFH